MAWGSNMAKKAVSKRYVRKLTKQLPPPQENILVAGTKDALSFTSQLGSAIYRGASRALTPTPLTPAQAQARSRQVVQATQDVLAFTGATQRQAKVVIANRREKANMQRVVVRFQRPTGLDMMGFSGSTPVTFATSMGSNNPLQNMAGNPKKKTQNPYDTSNYTNSFRF